MLRRKVPLISGLELGLQQSQCLQPAILITSQNSHFCEGVLDLKAAEATQSHPEAKAACRMQNAERRKTGQSHPKPHQSHPIATSKPPQSLLVATPLRPQSHSKATLKPLQSHPKATARPPSSQLIGPLQNLGGAEPTCFPRALVLMRIAVLRPADAVLTSLAPDLPARCGSVEADVRANARLFHNRQALDWAIVRNEALPPLRELSLPEPAKVITFTRPPAAVAARKACVSGERGWRANSCRMESFCSLHRRGFAARSCGRSCEKCGFRRRSFACTGLFELGSFSKP
jgi:hypothetical protein